jgi:hypothetical protein
LKGIEITIHLRDFLKCKVSTRQDGTPLREYLSARWDEVDKFVIDFGNLSIASVSFMDEAFGMLAESYGRRELKKKLEIRNIDEQDESLLNGIVRSRLKQFSRQKAVS